MPPAPAPGGEARLALAAGAGSYVIWGVVPLVFQLLGRMGTSPWEILAHRTVWGAPTALLFVLLARQGGAALAVLRSPRTLAWLALSAGLISINWASFIWAVNSGRVLQTSLGYYLSPILSMAVGALLFRERLDGAGRTAVALAASGVALQVAALGGLPWVSLAVAVSFCGYGIVRKRVSAEAQTGLLMECVILSVPGVLYVAWLAGQGQSQGLASPAALAWLVACGPLTALPLALFAWSARRIAFSTMGFLQFIAPTMTFVLGVAQGEPFTPLRAVSFAFIWAGAGVFVWGAWRAQRRAGRALQPAE